VTTAIVTWLVLAPVAMILPPLAHVDPFAMRGAMLPVAVGGLLLAAFIAVFLGLPALLGRPVGRRAHVFAEPLAGAAAGIFAAWVALTLRTALNGTPFGFAGLTGDTGRLTAMAERYSVTLTSADGIVADVAAEYPPLYPWLIGRASAITAVPAWRLLGVAEILTTSAAVLVAFLLWQRLVSPPVALAIAVAGLAAFGEPRKAYEVIALAVFVPWTLATLGMPPRGRLRWLPGGVIGGLLILTYHGFLMWASLGVISLAWLTWRAADDRRGYLLHLVKVVVVATAVASWYLVPYLVALLRHGGQMVADLYQSPSIPANPFPFLVATPLGVLQLTGLAGALWYRRTAWWATPLLCLVLGTYLYRALMLMRFVVDGHTGQLYYTSRLVSGLLAAAGVLTLVQVVPGLFRRLATRPAPPRGLGAAVLAILIAWTGFTYWRTWMPGPAGSPSAIAAAPRAWPANYTTYAHVEPLPSGRRPRYAPDRPATRWFPVDPIRRAVSGALGPDATPRTLSYDERLFAYLPWPGYIAVDRTAAYTPTRFDDRHAALVRLATVADPVVFAQAGAHTPFGRIDLFVLRRSGADWVWRDVHFHPGQFGPTDFAIVADLPENTVLAIRRPAH
jgi:hypothetical protein